MNILITGGAGYIGSHTAVELSADNHTVIIVDDYSNSSPEVIKRLQRITGKLFRTYEGDIRNIEVLEKVFSENQIDAVLHLAGFKAVGESMAHPLAYYRNNLDTTLTLCEVMTRHNVKKLLFSSTATVYGEPQYLPLNEAHRAGVDLANTYARTKYMIEQILQDLAFSDPTWAITCLRYFNPIGAHSSGLIGEDPKDEPNNLLPYVAQVAVGKLERVRVFGDDYDTDDGTGVRDYIHIVDLARGHASALEHLKPGPKAQVFNLGTGKGSSVMEVIHAFEKASDKKIPYEVVARRPGDIAKFYADPSKAEHELGWHADLSLEDACRDSWHWQSKNPDGYAA
jgi:UDP-glucose 4-epimerase